MAKKTTIKAGQQVPFLNGSYTVASVTSKGILLVPSDIGSKMIAFRKNHGDLTQRGLAGYLLEKHGISISQAKIAKIENGQQSCPLEVLAVINA